MKKYFYLVSEEHLQKIEQSNLDPQTCYEFLNHFIPFKKDEDFVPVHSKELESITYKYKEYITFFVRNKIIFSNNYYSKEKHLCREYKLREINPSPYLRVPMQSLKFINRLHNSNTTNKKRMKLLSKQETFRRMKNTFIEFIQGIDTDALLEYVNQEDSVGQRLRLAREIYMIKDNNIYFKRNSTNFRLDSNLTNLRSDYKYFHTRNDLSVIDLKNSQPFLLSYLLNYYTSITSNTILSDVDVTGATAPFIHKVRGLPFNSDDIQILSEGLFSDFKELKRYTELCQNGTLYEYLATHFNTNRDEAKLNVMKIFYSANNLYRKEKKVFNKLFPQVGKFMRVFKDIYGYETFAILLQRMESELVLDNVCRIMVTQGITPLTIHDSWIVPTDKVQESIDIINSIFIIPPRISVDHYVDKQKELNIAK